MRNDFFGGDVAVFLEKLAACGAEFPNLFVVPGYICRIRLDFGLRVCLSRGRSHYVFESYVKEEKRKDRQIEENRENKKK